MLKFLKDKKKDNKGFTLVELVIVVAILAILVGILAPQYTKYVEKSRKAADASNLENLVTVIKTAAADSTDSIPADEYKIEITAADTTPTTITAKGGSDINDVVESFAGADWQNTKLKSKKWNTDNKISATVVVDEEGAITVTYDPADVKDLVK